MPFAKISRIEGWQDFGFRFKEGTNETSWDDRHDILTFRYTEPMTWWMPMPEGTPRTTEAALEEATRLAETGDRYAQALFVSGYYDAAGRNPVRLVDRPWCNGAVWSLNSMPGLRGSPIDFELKWSSRIKVSLNIQQ